ncbi:MAG: potassium-transporting ATPase subunit KdpC [Acidobacteriota bacterium]|nr:potassium-transporting ATPase subunit KdpC [Acidobacteriota bacterium]
MIKQLIPALRIALSLTVLTGLIYPMIVTGLCQRLFPVQANGSLIEHDGRIIGSDLIGQRFSRPEYFHPRPSTSGSCGYDASASGGSNLGPTSRKLADRVQSDISRIRMENPDYRGLIPADMATASGSGLDPHISPASARVQASRIARARHASIEQIESLLRHFTENPDLGFLGEPRINVLRLNIALDRRVPMVSSLRSESIRGRTIASQYGEESAAKNTR